MRFSKRERQMVDAIYNRIVEEQDDDISTERLLQMVADEATTLFRRDIEASDVVDVLAVYATS